MPTKRVVLLFPTTHAVMHAAQVLAQCDIAHDIIPRPKGVDADCGIAVSVAPESREGVLSALKEAQREPSRVLELVKP